MAMDDLPVFKKCCFCVPLRYGLLSWGYVKLGAAFIGLAFYIIVVLALRRFLFVDSLAITIVSVIALILITEITLHIVFIVGAHKKNVKLLQAYYQYAVFMWILMIIMCFGSTSFLIWTIFIDYGPDTGFLITLNVVAFVSSIAVQTFLVMSLRSEIIKLRSNCPYRFVKNENDPEGTINSVKDEEESPVDSGNGTMPIL
ncbi:hypothetical protein PYW07_012065 [Mythimna separata]|uniref:Uncharacterized protein n=1 Tax=Mythimna separata TaxID=271217 RepID=A0AAD7YKH6_MYTSE|nr:hypothetical protein PYW07_012065 [Mythimna separata]